jgi:hypothetical protein
MAYSATVTITHAGGRDYLVTISETEAAAASEATITGLPKKGLLLAQLADKTAHQQLGRSCYPLLQRHRRALPQERCGCWNQ